MYVLAQSDARIDKERAMRRKRLRRYVDRLQGAAGQTLTRDQLLMKLGAARHEAGRAANLVQGDDRRRQRPTTSSLEFRLDREQAAPGAPPRRPLPAAHQPDAPASPSSCGRSTSSSPRSSRRSRNSSTTWRCGRSTTNRGAHRGAHLRGLPRLLPAGHAQGAAQATGRRHHAARGARQVQDDADGRRALSRPPTAAN